MDTSAHAFIMQFFNEQIPFNRFLGMQLVELSDGFARIELPFKEELIGDRSRPALHGGVLSSLIDVAGGAAAFSNVKVPDDTLSTLDMRVDYLRPAELRALIADARVTRMGNRVASVDISVCHDDSTQIATGKAVYSIKRGYG